jgi:hypothetical protein
VADLRPTWCISVAYRLKTATGEPLSGLLHGTIHCLAR